MEATKDHISLKTARLLKDCGVDSIYFFNRHLSESSWEITRTNNSEISHWETLPAYTWQEILCEHQEKFFGLEFSSRLILKIVHYLVLKKYEEADNYFLNHCTLINKE